MLPQSFVGVIIALLLVIGTGTIVHFIGKAISKEKERYALPFYAMLVIIGILSPYTAAFAAALSIGFVVWGKVYMKIAGVASLVVLGLLALLPHMFIIFKI